jgi:hypothetical protein
MSTQTMAAGLQPYREQARELSEALAKVKGIHEQTAAVTQQREAVLQQRQSLLDSFEDESAVAELSKLGSRVEMCDAKLANQAVRLGLAETVLKAATAQFAISFRNLSATLSTWTLNNSVEQIAALVHPEIRPICRASIIEVAGMTTPVVELRSLEIRVEPGIDSFQSTLPISNFLLAAERILAKSEALLAEAGKRIENGFVPPEPFTLAQWQATVSQTPVAAAA